MPRKHKIMSKTILITGAASGFGKIVAFDLAKKGHKVIATTQIYPQMSDLIREAKEQGIELTVDKLDVTNTTDIKYIVNKYDIDILISNAGIAEAGPIAEQPIDLIRSMFEVNVFGALALAQAFIKKFIDEKKTGQNCFHHFYGRIVDGSLCCFLLCVKTCNGCNSRRLKNRIGVIQYQNRNM